MTRSYLTKRDHVAEWLRNEILTGALAPGSQLHQNEIAERLSVSPTPVREAFRALVAEGLLRSRPHHGVVVGDDKFEDMTAVYELRSLIEVAALRRTLARLDDALVKRLKGLLDDSAAALATASLAATRLANTSFHVVLIEGAGTLVYADVASSLINRSKFYLPLDEPRMRSVLEQHRTIYDHIRTGDTEGAIQAFESHMSANLQGMYEARREASGRASKAARRRRGSSSRA